MNWLNDLVEQCRSKEELTDIFGIILYTDAHANINKVLSDHEYWSAFHEISGKNWVIFSIKTKKGYYGTPDLKPGQMGLMFPVWKEPNDNKPLLKEFELRDTEDLPQLLVFTHGAEGEILKQSLKIDDTSVETAYNSIKKVIEVVTNAVENISPENRRISDGVFQAVDRAVSSHKEWELIKKGLNFYTWLKGLMP